MSGHPQTEAFYPGLCELLYDYSRGVLQVFMLMLCRGIPNERNEDVISRTMKTMIIAASVVDASPRHRTHVCGQDKRGHSRCGGVLPTWADQEGPDLFRTEFP